jgi:rsbT antagonist protein RsbS
MKQGGVLIASVQSELSDTDLIQLRDDLLQRVGILRTHGVVIDVTALDVIDSFAARVLSNIAQMVRLRGATTVIAGIQADVAFSMIQLGLALQGVTTVLDLEEALSVLAEAGESSNGSS